MRKLSNKAIITNSLGTVFGLIVVVVIVAAGFIGGLADVDASVGITDVSKFSDWLTGAGLLLITVSIGYSVVWVKLFGYEIADNEVKIERGVIAKSYDSIPFSRIQNVGIERSLLQRVLGISTVDIQTAGASRVGRAEGSIPGIDKEIAETVREKTMQKARLEKQESGV
ncbi:MAG: hypothetical protein BRC25_00155 [Parcubacteria group bacterium SW_6_46_9]|nr:MAG: hypothetical protein BRC25_00155 [Parcubacteria group bacterium SW_6_46_9]